MTRVEKKSVSGRLARDERPQNPREIRRNCAKSLGSRQNDQPGAWWFQRYIFAPRSRSPMSTLPNILRRVGLALALFAFAGGCRAGGCAANVLGDVIGETGDAYCDRRFVATGKEPAPFCQEIIDTIAQSQFTEDCRDKHGARSDEGKCPRERIIAGCKLSKVNDDGSDVYDWYYDVSDLEAAARDAAADAEVDAGDGGLVVDTQTTAPLFKDPVRTKEEVKKLCADKTRYEEGATFAEP